MTEERTAVDPIHYEGGRVVLHPQFKEWPELKACAPLFLKSRDRANALFTYLFYVYSPRSIYRNVPEKDRITRFFYEKKVLPEHVEWLKQTLLQGEVQQLIDTYCMTVMLPSQRLFLGLVENVDRWTDEAVRTKGDASTEELEELIKKGEMLHESAERIAKMVQQEKDRRVRGGYVPRKFERRKNVDEQPSTLRLAS